ncbi:MAG: GH25 family lysozyme [Pirellulales bacterium]
MRCPTTKVLFWFTVCLVVLGAVSPVCALIEGVDVSNYQGSINWTSVKNAGIQFAFCKATEGVDYVDPRFSSYMSGALAAGIPIGPYHFARLNSGETNPNDAIDEANDFVDAISRFYQGSSLVMRPVLDLEQIPDNSVAPLTVRQYVSEWARDFCAQVESRLGITPIIYTGSSFASSYVESDLTKYPLWLANWNYTPPSVPPRTAYSPWRSFAFWQYTDSGSVNGIPATVDRDVFNGTMAQLTQYMPTFLPGDFDRDGTVDAADYTVWRNTLGQTVALGTGADGNLSGTIDEGDYSVWTTNFGVSAGSGALTAAAAVPEPAAMFLVMASALVAIAAPERSRR